MAEYISREAFITRQRKLYCQNCDRRRGMKDGKFTKRFVYPIGGAPCRACDVDDMINAVEDYPATDVVEVVRCKDCKHYNSRYFELSGEYYGTFCDLYHYGFKPDFFCAKGEKREVEHET